MASLWSQNGDISMPVNLSIKNTPDAIVTKLRERAKRHHRSLQGELMAILEDSVLTEGRWTPDAVLAETQRLGLSTPAEAVGMIRSDRDDR
jgi:antitoxin FitA